MSGSTISGTINDGNSGVLIGTGYDASPLTVLSTGVIRSSGVYAVEGLNPGITLLNYGSIEALSGTGVSFTSGGVVHNLGTGALIEGTVGIESRNARTLDVVNQGTVLGLPGTYSAGILITSTNASGSAYVFNEGTSALIHGGEAGIAITLPGTVINQGTVSAGDGTATAGGIELLGGGSVTNQGAQGLVTGYVGVGLGTKLAYTTNYGTISGVYAGVDFFGPTSGGTVSNLGSASLIQGSFGVYFRAQYSAGPKYSLDSVYNAGRIVGGASTTLGFGVDVQGGVTLTNASSGLISGGSVGVYATAASQLSNEGSIEGGTYGVKLAAGGTLNNLGTGAVISSSNGIAVTSVVGSLHGSIDITNEGTIKAFSGSGAHPAQYYALSASVYMYGGTLVNSGTAALISGGLGVLVYNRTAYVANSGTITGVFGGVGINKGGGTIANLGAHALIEGGYLGIGGGIEGVRTNGTLTTVYNQGSIIATGVDTLTGGSFAFGVDADYGLVLTNAASGFISSEIDGVYDGLGLALVSNAGTIEGGVFGLYLTQLGTYDNSATITNTAGGLISGGSIGILAGEQTSAQYNISTIRNSGTVAGGTTGIKISKGGYVGNLTAGATITGGAYGVIIYDGGNVTNQGTINGTLDGGVVMRGPATVINSGSAAVISGGQYGVKLVAGGNLFDSGTISSQNVAIESYYGAVQLTFAPGAVIHGSVATDTRYSAVMELAAGSTHGVLDMGGSFSGIGTIDFDAGANWVLGGTAAELANGQFINGFTLGDGLILDGFTATSSMSSGEDLTLSNGVSEYIIDFNASVLGHQFVFTDVAQGTEITICHLRGTKIAVPDGEAAIEDLRIGDLVRTRFSGTQRIKWIGEQRYNSLFLTQDMLPVCISASALAEGVPTRDLFVSPGHSLLIDGTLVLARDLINGVTVTQFWAPDEVHYFNIELDNHDCVLAEGAWSETYADCPGLRAKFHNSASFFALYPNQTAPAEPQLCAPRPLEGPRFEAALAPVLARAEAETSFGRVFGYLEDIGPCGSLRGWAQDEANPEMPLCLDILTNGAVVGKVIANLSRADVRDAGFNGARCGFIWTPTANLSGADITVRHTGSGKYLAHLKKQAA